MKVIYYLLNLIVKNINILYNSNYSDQMQINKDLVNCLKDIKVIEIRKEEVWKNVERDKEKKMKIREEIGINKMNSKEV